MKTALTSTVILLGLLACESKETHHTSPADRQREEVNLGGLEESNWVTYQGSIPCADCERIEIEIRLENYEQERSGEFDLYETYVGTRDGDRTVESFGSYEIQRLPDSEDQMIVLNTENNRLIRLSLEDNGDLTLLDQEGQKIESSLNYSLKRK
ncbi:copper resistance protein NlpE N-terminal domain-containing protein [Litoribacter alkaliphilus]|uniref:Copper resistance protein NlpE N-terminal domain-containing protein n=1 Tax=Litoribacter ruber TaxID=702568 RepID=A0AAP2G353_9BACT|nr:copper resistance protein NlpE N-terminal domain-containing protein [Litoribacter alkaliphilus]MBS9522696.1 copper resistance protein NlpE N-terminal domain-containing protein [Litoribacter alkaliphilus]